MTNFRVGQKVVCVDARSKRLGGAPLHAWPTEGQVYTISGGYSKFVYLSELGWPAFYADRFRPAVERGEETGMSILRKILTDNRVDA